MTSEEGTAEVQDSGTEAVETSTSSEPVETAEASSETTVDTGPSDWNGELESLRSAEWFNGVDETTRDKLLGGLENKYKNWQRGYTKAFEAAASQRKHLQSREDELKASELRVQRWLYGDENPLDAKNAEFKSLKEAHEAAVAQMTKEHEEILSKRSEVSQEDLQKIITERDEAKKVADEIQAKAQAAESAALDQEVEEWDNWLKGQAPELYEQVENAEEQTRRNNSFNKFCQLAAMADVTREQALTLVRTLYPAPESTEPPAPAPEPVPESINLMNLGTSQASTTAQGNASDFAEMMDSLRRQAQGRQ